MNHIDPSDKAGRNTLIFSMGFVILFIFYMSFVYSGVALDRPEIPAEEVSNGASSAE